MNRRWVPLLAVGFWLCLIPPPALAQATALISADGQFAFAESYFEQGEYYRAIGEYQRFIYFFPEDPRRIQALYRIGESYLKGRQYEQALESFQALLEMDAPKDFMVKVFVGITECYEGMGEPEKAVSTLELLKKRYPDRDVTDEGLYRQGWFHLEMGNWQSARNAFDRISPENGGQYRLEALSEAMARHDTLPYRRPAVAGGLALLPGAGHLYCGRPHEALMAFALNGAMIWAAIEAFDEDHDVLGGVIAFFELGFYSGNIYSAVNCAHKYNRRQERGFLEYLRQHSVLKVSMGPAVVLSYNLTF